METKKTHLLLFLYSSQMSTGALSALAGLSECAFAHWREEKGSEPPAEGAAITLMTQ